MGESLEQQSSGIIMRNLMTRWNRVLHDEFYSRTEPDEVVIDLANLLEKGKRVLDLGCGAGRHAVYMARRQFETHGADISKTGLNTTRRRLRKEDLRASLVECSMTRLPYTDSHFDAVICLNVVYHQRLEGIQKTILEVMRVLKRNGLFLANFLSKRTYSYGKGREVEEDTFVEQEGPEKGIIHSFIDMAELELLFEAFTHADFTLLEKEVEGKLQSRWVVKAHI